MNISFENVRNYYITSPSLIGLRFVVIPTTIGEDHYLFGSPVEGCNVADEIYEQLKTLPDQPDKEIDIAELIFMYADEESRTFASRDIHADDDQIFITFSPEQPNLTILNPVTQKKTIYPVSLAEFKKAFIEYYESDGYKSAASKLTAW